eukprot:15365812-Ditylum_brightwellii.AAC.2
MWKLRIPGTAPEVITALTSRAYGMAHLPFSTSCAESIALQNHQCRNVGAQQHFCSYNCKATKFSVNHSNFVETVNNVA